MAASKTSPSPPAGAGAAPEAMAAAAKTVTAAATAERVAAEARGVVVSAAEEVETAAGVASVGSCERVGRRLAVSVATKAGRGGAVGPGRSAVALAVSPAVVLHGAWIVA